MELLQQNLRSTPYVYTDYGIYAVSFLLRHPV